MIVDLPDITECYKLIGGKVVIVNLNSEKGKELNNKQGRIIGMDKLEYDSEINLDVTDSINLLELKFRFHVKFDDGKIWKIKHCNM